MLSILIYLAPQKFNYILTRFSSFFDPEKSGTSQSEKATEAIRQGGLKGQGMGEGILKESVPEAHTDYIIAVITEEFGSIISIIVINGKSTAGTPLGTNILKYLKPCLTKPIIVTAININKAIIKVTIM